MSFINNANQIIGANMRYLQQLQANPQMLTGTQSTTGTSDSMASMMMPMLMMMMFQLMSQQHSNQTSQMAQSGAAYGQDPMMGYSTMMPTMQPPYQMPPMQAPPFQMPPQQASPGLPPMPGQQDQWLQQNPAYQFLSAQLGVSNASTSNSGDTGNLPYTDFSNNTSLANTMNALLYSTTNDPNLQSFGTQLLNGNYNGDDPDTLKSQVQNTMMQDGSNTNAVEGFGILYDAMLNNNSLDLANMAVATNATTANANQVTQLSQMQSQLADQWQTLFPSMLTSAATPGATTSTTGASTSTAPSSTDLTQSVQEGLANGLFTPNQLGQSLKYLLDNAPSDSLPSIGGLIGNLTKNGYLNIIPFLQSQYLDKLTPERQQTLLNAVESAGLTLSSGQPNSRFAGFLLENLSRPGASSTQEFLQKFLQNDWLANGQNTTSAEGQALQNVLSLVGIQGTAGQPLNLIQ